MLPTTACNGGTRLILEARVVDIDTNAHNVTIAKSWYMARKAINKGNIASTYFRIHFQGQIRQILRCLFFQPRIRALADVLKQAALGDQSNICFGNELESLVALMLLPHGAYQNLQLTFCFCVHIQQISLKSLVIIEFRHGMIFPNKGSWIHAHSNLLAPSYHGILEVLMLTFQISIIFIVEVYCIANGYKNSASPNSFQRVKNYATNAKIKGHYDDTGSVCTCAQQKHRNHAHAPDARLLSQKDTHLRNDEFMRVVSLPPTSGSASKLI
jgi:hypothetical protein